MSIPPARASCGSTTSRCGPTGFRCWTTSRRRTGSRRAWAVLSGSLHGVVSESMEATGMLANARRALEASRAAGRPGGRADDHPQPDRLPGGLPRDHVAPPRHPQGRRPLVVVHQGLLGLRDRRRRRTDRLGHRHRGRRPAVPPRHQPPSRRRGHAPGHSDRIDCLHGRDSQPRLVPEAVAPRGLVSRGLEHPTPGRHNLRATANEHLERVGVDEPSLAQRPEVVQGACRSIHALSLAAAKPAAVRVRSRAGGASPYRWSMSCASVGQR